MLNTGESSERVLVTLSLLPEVAVRVEKARQLLEAKDYEEVFSIGFRFLEWYLLLRQGGASLFQGYLISKKRWFRTKEEIVGEIVTLNNL